jgi:hypothetical protein
MVVLGSQPAEATGIEELEATENLWLKCARISNFKPACFLDMIIDHIICTPRFLNCQQQKKAYQVILRKMSAQKWD